MPVVLDPIGGVRRRHPDRRGKALDGPDRAARIPYDVLSTPCHRCTSFRSTLVRSERDPIAGPTVEGEGGGSRGGEMTRAMRRPIRSSGGPPGTSRVGDAALSSERQIGGFSPGRSRWTFEPITASLSPTPKKERRTACGAVRRLERNAVRDQKGKESAPGVGMGLADGVTERRVPLGRRGRPGYR